MRNSLLFLLLLSLLMPFSSCWAADYSDISLLKHTGLIRFSTEQGLSQNTINQIYQDPAGYIWIATEAGLNRLDGNQINHVDTPKALLKSAAISNVKQDSQGTLWVAAFDQLFRLSQDRKTNESITLPQIGQASADNNFVVELLEDIDGLFWIVTQQGIVSLQLVGKEIKTFASMAHLAKQRIQVSNAIQDKKIIWLATNKGLYQFNKITHQLKKQILSGSFNNANVTSLLKVSNEQLLITTREGSLILNTANNKITLINQSPTNAAAQLGEQIFLAVDHFIYSYQLSSQSLQKLFSLTQVLPQFAYYKIENLLIDKNNMLWLGTESHGAYLWNPDSLKYKSLFTMTNNPQLQLSNNSVWDMWEDSNDDLWLATDNGLNQVNRKEATISHYLTSDAAGLNKKSARILFIHEKANNLWLATADGLIRFNKNNGDIQQFKPTGLKPDAELFIYAITETPDGKLWLATGRGAISFDPETATFRADKEITDAHNPQESTLIRYQNGLIWIGYADRLIAYDFRRKLVVTKVKFNHLKKDYNLSLTDFEIDGKKLWVSFNAAGIYVMDLTSDSPQLIKHFSQKDGFVDNIIHTLVDHQSFIWASSHNGLIKINKKDFSYQVFDYNDGLSTSEFNEGAGVITRSGNLLFGGSNGILQIIPEELDNSNKSVSAQITSVSTHQQDYMSNGIRWKDRGIQVNERLPYLTINLSVFDYTSPYKWRYEYWFDQKDGPQDTNLPLISKDQSIALSSLNAGDYLLNIRAVIPHSNRTSEVIQFPFKVVADGSSFWRWIIAIVLSLVAVVAFIAYRQQQKQLLAENHLLTQSKQRLELALLGKQQGIWDWRNLGDSIADSSITVILQQSENLVISLKQYRSYVHKGDVRTNQRQWIGFLQGKNDEISLSYRVFLFEKWIWCRVHGRITQRLPSGKPARATGTWTDISEDRNNSQQLERYKTAVESTHDIILILDKNYSIKQVNYSFERLTAFSSERLLGHSLLRLASKRLSVDAVESLKSQLLTQKHWQGEISIPRKNATSISLDVRINAFPPSKDAGGFVVVMSDISNQDDKRQSGLANAYFDRLTGLPNKLLATDRLSHAITHSQLYQTQVALLYLELDKLGFYQQSLGKEIGRKIIVAASENISQALAKDDTLARLEDGRFYIILENLSGLDSLAFKTEEIREKLSHTINLANTEITLSACIGLACYPQDANSAHELKIKAASALHQARTQGNNQINFYLREMNLRVSERISMKNSMLQGLDNNQFFLVFQPLFNLAHKKPLGFEVFVRWRTSEGKVIYPSQFLKLAEESGLMEALTEWLIEQSMRTLSRWKSDGISSHFAINLIPQFCQHIGSANYLMEKLASYQLETKNICIEINEKHFNSDKTSIIDYINQLSNMGIKVTLDDFGSGNSPLGFLEHLSLDSIKLNKTLIRSIGKSKNNDALIASLVSMAKALGQSVVAKSIELPEQRDFLIAAGVETGQGYFYSDPLSENSARQFMLDQNKK